MLTLISDASTSPVDDLVSALEWALSAVKSSKRSPRADDRDGGDARRLVAELDALSGPERDQVAQAFTQLWDAFNDRFDGLQGFLAAEYADRTAYVTQLERAGERMAAYQHCSAAHYYQATALMLAYVKGILHQQSLQSRVIEAVHRGRVLSRELPHDHGAGTTLQVASPLLAG